MKVYRVSIDCNPTDPQYDVYNLGPERKVFVAPTEEGARKWKKYLGKQGGVWELEVRKVWFICKNKDPRLNDEAYWDRYRAGLEERIPDWILTPHPNPKGSIPREGVVFMKDILSWKRLGMSNKRRGTKGKPWR